MQSHATDRSTATPDVLRGITVRVADAFHTGNSLSPTILRVVLAAVLFPHGAQHLLGWFGGYGFGGTYEWITGLGFPGPLAAAAIVTEFLAPLALAAGIATRAAAVGVIGLMVGAASVHVRHGFFMNWFGRLPAGAEGFEYHLLMASMALALAIAGAGRWSLDRVLADRLDGTPQEWKVRP